MFLLAPATVSAATLYSVSVSNIVLGEHWVISNSPTPVSVSTRPLGCEGSTICGSATASAGLSLAVEGSATAQSFAIGYEFTLTSTTNATASFSGYDVVLSGPSGQSTLTSLNLIFDGDVHFFADRAVGVASVDISTTLTGPGGAATDSGTIAVSTGGALDEASGLLSGWPGPGPLFAVRTSSLMVDAGDVVTLGLSLGPGPGGGASCSTFPLETFASCSAQFSVDAFSFPTTGPVFNLPAGWTANSVDGTIVNNLFVIPEPSTALLLSGGLIALAVRRRN